MNHKKHEGTVTDLTVSKDEALFEALGKSKKKKKKKIIRTVITIVLILAILLISAVNILQRRVRQEFALGDVEVISYEVTTGTISTVVSGSGTLQNVDTETVALPSGVELRDILVSYGDAVEEGALIATVDMGTVCSAMSELQTTIEDLDEQIADAEGDQVSAYIKAGVSGRVKILYAQKDMEVADVMVAHGALAVISLDGFMAVDIQTDALTVGDGVTVIRADGSEISGTVDYAAGGTTTVLVTDNGPEYDEEVTVHTEEGTKLGSGKLYIHNPLSVTGYAGTVSYVNAAENQKVYASSTLYTLTNRASSANYDALLRSRKEAEEALLELLRIQRNGGIVAPISGSIASTEGTSEEETLVAAISPDQYMSVTITVDEGDILSLEIGQQGAVTVSSVSEDAFSGTVTEIDRTGATGAYSAVILLEKQSGMLPGMTASVDVRIQGVDDALIIPVEALNRTANGAYVYTSYDEETQTYGGRVDVVTGISNNNYVQIKSGLKVGDTVYYTEEQNFGNMFGNRDNMGGNIPGGMPDFSGGSRPDMGGQMPDMGGKMPDMNGNNRPNGG
ncbi:MAG: HlyD family efflux transporter periplasmic adaptor subunit [Ruminococcaceae bacterium]|nr:HlyD family efflux transporter periplasmic adaptor subunit [Oscillospiraceae bacterium]